LDPKDGSVFAVIPADPTLTISRGNINEPDGWGGTCGNRWADNLRAKAASVREGLAEGEKGNTELSQTETPL
jgi:hypothetical protein